MPHYTYQHIPDTPLWRVYADGNYRQEFTSLAAAKAYVEHLQQHEDKLKRQARVWDDIFDVIGGGR